MPEPGVRGYSAVQVQVRARVTVEPGARLSVLAAAGEHTAELEILIVRHRASGWVREIARKDEDQLIEAEFDPETGVVTVYEGRREFRELERAARRAGYTKKRASEYVPYRMLEVEASANAVYAWAAQQILSRRLPDERPSDPAEYAAAVHQEHQTLRHRAHHKLMQAFLEPEIFEGAVTLARPPVHPPPDSSTRRQQPAVNAVLGIAGNASVPPFTSPAPGTSPGRGRAVKRSRRR